jgi:hypothetical protein
MCPSEKISLSEHLAASGALLSTAICEAHSEIFDHCRLVTHPTVVTILERTYALISIVMALELKLINNGVKLNASTGELTAFLCQEIGKHEYRRVRREWNRATSKNLTTLNGERIIAVSGLDCGVMPSTYEGQYYDSRIHGKLPLKRVARALILDFDSTKKTRTITYRCLQESASLDSLYAECEQSEILSGDNCSALLFAKFKCSSNPAERARAEDWETISLPKTIKSYCEKYLGNASYKDGEERVVVCTPYIPKFSLGEGKVIEFLENLETRMGDAPYLLGAFHGFTSYHQETGKYPWE